MKTSNWLVLGLVFVLPVSVQTRAQTTDISTLDQNMVAACPAVWEDIKSEIDPGLSRETCGTVTRLTRTRSRRFWLR